MFPCLYNNPSSFFLPFSFVSFFFLFLFVFSFFLFIAEPPPLSSFSSFFRPFLSTSPAFLFFSSSSEFPSLIFFFSRNRQMANEDDVQFPCTTSDSDCQPEPEAEGIEEAENVAMPEVVRELGNFEGVPPDQEIHAYWRPLPSYNWGGDSTPTELPEYEWPSCFYFFWLPVIVASSLAALHLYYLGDKVDWSK